MPDTHGQGPCVLTQVTAKRLATMAWANEKESELIITRGGPWRDGSYGTAQALNAKRGGQGDPWRVLKTSKLKLVKKVFGALDKLFHPTMIATRPPTGEVRCKTHAIPHAHEEM